MKPYVIQLVSNPVWGGGEQYVLDLSRRLLDEGYEVEVVARPAGNVVEKFQQVNVPVRRLPLRGNFDFISSVMLSHILRKAPSPVVVHAHNFKTAANAVTARRLSGRNDVRIVVTRHLVKPGKADSYHTYLYSEIDRLVFVSALSRDRFLSAGPTVDRSKITVVHPGVDHIADSPVMCVGAAGGDPVIMWHGRINPEKGLATLIEALGTLKSHRWQLKLAGTGSARDVSPLVRRIRELGIDDRVEWLGYINDIHRCIRDLGVYVGVIPSRVPEAFGLALVDYMSCGVPVISSNNGAQPEIIIDGNDGFLVSPDDSSALASALTRILGDPSMRDRMATAALASVASRFSYNRFFTELTHTYISQ